MSVILRPKLRRHLARAAVVAAVVATGVVAAPAGPAQADDNCNFGCSETHNHTSLGVLAGRYWGEPYRQTMWLAQWQQTPGGEDWDAFRVDAGWCYKVSWRTYGVYTHTTKYDQRGKGERWIQVHNQETAIVVHQSTSNCG